jgi:hypothetical protein
MERSAPLSSAEIVGIAAAAAAALGGVVVALSRSQSPPPQPEPQLPVPALVASADGARIERGRELARGAMHYVASTYPDVRQSAVGIAQRISATARPRATELSERTSERAQQARLTGVAALERAQETIVPAATGAITRAFERASQVREQAQPAREGAVAIARAKAGSAVATSSHAARESLATVVWVAAASAVVYFGLLSAERREQIKSFITSAYEQVELLIRDFQGYEDDF